MIAVSVAASLLLVAAGCLIIAAPELLPTVIVYATGIGCVLLGIVLSLSVLRSALEIKSRKAEQ